MERYSYEALALVFYKEENFISNAEGEVTAETPEGAFSIMEKVLKNGTIGILEMKIKDSVWEILIDRKTPLATIVENHPWTLILRNSEGRLIAKKNIPLE